MMPRLDSPLYHHRLDATADQAVRLNPIAIKTAMVILARSWQDPLDASVLFCTPADRWRLV
jgi:hypothetical protein